LALGGAVMFALASSAAQWAIPVFILVVVVHGWYKGVRVYETFVEGAREGFWLAVRILPYIVGIYVAIGVFRESGALAAVTNPLQPLLNWAGVPVDILPLMLVRPLSGPPSLGLILEIFDRFGPDSFIGRLASVIYGSTETTIYVLAVYFASVGIKKARYSLAVGLMADLAGYVAAIIICKRVFLG